MVFTRTSDGLIYEESKVSSDYLAHHDYRVSSGVFDDECRRDPTVKMLRLKAESELHSRRTRSITLISSSVAEAGEEMHASDNMSLRRVSRPSLAKAS